MKILKYNNSIVVGKTTRKDLYGSGVLKKFFILGIVLVMSCSNITYSSGTLGGGVRFEFNCSREQLQDGINNYSLLDKCSKKGNKFWDDIGYGFLDGKVFCLSDTLKCYVSLVKFNLNDNSETIPSALSDRAICINEEWTPVKDCNNDIVEKVDNIFYERVIKKISVYKYYTRTHPSNTQIEKR